MVVHQPNDGHPPEGNVLNTGNLALRLKTKLTPGDNCNGCSIKIPRRVTHQPKDGHPPEGSVPLTWNFAITYYTLLKKLTPGDNCHGWSPTIPQRVICPPKDGHLPTQGWSPTNPRKVTHQKKVNYRLRIGNLTLYSKN